MVWRTKSGIKGHHLTCLIVIFCGVSSSRSSDPNNVFHNCKVSLILVLYETFSWVGTPDWGRFYYTSAVNSYLQKGSFYMLKNWWSKILHVMLQYYFSSSQAVPIPTHPCVCQPIPFSATVFIHKATFIMLSHLGRTPAMGTRRRAHRYCSCMSSGLLKIVLQPWLCTG